MSEENVDLALQANEAFNRRVERQPNGLGAVSWRALGRRLFGAYRELLD
jgi:hypothetical protein